VLIASIYQWNETARAKERFKEILERYGELGEGPGVVAHYVFADGTGGIIITDGADPEFAYKTGLALGEFLDVDTRVVLPLDEALPIAMSYAGS